VEVGRHRWQGVLPPGGRDWVWRKGDTEEEEEERKKERKNWQEGDRVTVLKAQGFVCTSVRTDDGGLDSDDGGRNARNRGLVAKGERFYGLARTHLPWSCDCLRRHRSRCACKPPLPTLLTSSALRCCS
jgi:hypothetical protein